MSTTPVYNIVLKEDDDLTDYDTDKDNSSVSPNASPPTGTGNDIHNLTKEARESIAITLETELFINEVEKHYFFVAKCVVLVWLILSAISFYLGYTLDSMETLTGVERKAPLVACLLLGMSCMSSVMPMLVRGTERSMSGVIVCALTVQIIAFITDFSMAFFPTPVFIDHICGTKSYLLRYCEWTPLAFMMAFLTESCKLDELDIDSTNSTSGGLFSRGSLQGALAGIQKVDKNRIDPRVQASKRMRPAYQLAWTQGLSTFAGWCFPFMRGIFSWTICMIISCLLFAVLHIRLRKRILQFRQMTEGTTSMEKEMYNWSKLSLGLLRTCTYVWSTLVVVFFFCNVGTVLFPNSRILKTHGLSMLLESTLDVMFKAIYLLIVLDVHDSIFDSSARSERRLDELRQMMNVVWDNSSDVIGISVKGPSGIVTTMLSPTYLKLYYDSLDIKEYGPPTNAITFDLDHKYFEKQMFKGPIIASNIYSVDFSELTGNSAGEGSGRDLKEESPIVQEDMTSICELLVEAWKSKKYKDVLTKSLTQKKGHGIVSICCEATVTRVEDNALMIVIRDISERQKRFEAEKQVVSESTARQKDAAANRFTRHEIKNGILSAIGLCDSLREVLHYATVKKRESKAALDSISTADISHYLGENDATRCIDELDKTLHEILETVLSEAMARDVIHEVYEPKLECIDLKQLLMSTMNVSASKSNQIRFPIITFPNDFPKIAMDPLLMKCIHRNAISNACKYGKIGGTVTTKVYFDEDLEILRMNVINLPGEHHQDIIDIGPDVSDMVFKPRFRLSMHTTSEPLQHMASHSDGDGAWIMYKCATTLGGTCDIKFEKDRTVFNFTCPVKLFQDQSLSSSSEFRSFQLPKNLYGIAIDDSKIQRKLLARFFMFAGIPQDRIIIKGATNDEILQFGDWASAFIDAHPSDLFFMLVDENLEVEVDSSNTKFTTVSGSKLVSEMRERMLPDQERRLLALIRSANDSASDVAIYNSRAHGYIPKTPIKKDTVLDLVYPAWKNRFLNIERKPDNDSFEDDGADISLKDVECIVSDITTRFADLDQEALEKEWGSAWEKIHILKGDLQTLPLKSDNFISALQLINGLRGPSAPKDFRRTWYVIRELLHKSSS